MIEVGLLIFWSLQSLFCGAAVISLRIASRTKLEAELKRLGRETGLAEFDAHRHELALMALVLRQAAIVLFVITLMVLLRPRVGDTWLIVQTIAISFFWLMLVGVSIPAAWARYAGAGYVARLLPALLALRHVFGPILVAIRAVDEVVRRLAGVAREDTDQVVQMELEILDAVSQAETGGAVDQSEREMIKSVMDMDETAVGEIMTPRTDIIAIDASSDYDALLTLVRSEGHSRTPVYEGSLDKIVGVIYAKDLLSVEDTGSFSIRDHMRAVPFVPETKDVASLLREFQTSQVHMAIVLDEYGGTAGLVTIEDILEELVGEIADEHDDPTLEPIHRVDASTAEVDARVRVEELNETLEIALPEDEAYDTVGGYVFSKLGRIPSAGEAFTEENVRVEVIEAAERSIGRLRIRVLAPSAE